MVTKSKIILGLSSLLLIGTFLFPIWAIDLSAPQYPEGLGLRIWINQITGASANDVNTLNGLNHYIGMKTIEPESIPELKYMPYIVVCMLLSGLLIAWKGNRKHILIWIGTFILLGILGMYDFYMWEYNYGHNLNPDAAIKVPGMNYQPPFLGSKQLLNINATSLPFIGSYFIGLAILMAFLAYHLDKRNGTSSMEEKNKATKTLFIPGVLVIFLFLFNGCNDKPEDIKFGTDICEHCKMTITDRLFGAELCTRKGRIYKFDSIECLIGYQGENNITSNEVGSQWFINNKKPGELVKFDNTIFIQSDNIRSPMGQNIASLDRGMNPLLNKQSPSEKFLSWNEVVAYIEQNRQ